MHKPQISEIMAQSAKLLDWIHFGFLLFFSVYLCSSQHFHQAYDQRKKIQALPDHPFCHMRYMSFFAYSCILL